MNDTQINDLRRRVLAGEQVSNDELKAALAAIRTKRKEATVSVAARATPKVAAKPVDLQALVAASLAKKRAPTT